MWIAILKQEFPKVIKGRFKQESGGANSVTAISKCTNKIYFVRSFIKLVAGTAVTFTLAKRNGGFMIGKRNISVLSLRMTPHQPLLTI